MASSATFEKYLFRCREFFRRHNRIAWLPAWKLDADILQDIKRRLILSPRCRRMRFFCLICWGLGVSEGSVSRKSESYADPSEQLRA